MYGGQLPGKRLTSFLVNEEVLVDAGGVTESLTLKEQIKIGTILISHTHLDHIRDIPFLADNILGRREKPIPIVATEQVIQGLKDHFLNNSIWPDFTVIPSRESPVLRWETKKEETPFATDHLEVEFVRTNHPVPTFAMFLKNNRGDTILYSADTGPTERIWEKVKKYRSSLKGIILEVSFPNRLKEISLLSGHLTPAMIPEELRKGGKLDLPIYLFHIKPVYEEEILEEIQKLKDPRLSPLTQGETLQI